MGVCLSEDIMRHSQPGTWPALLPEFEILIKDPKKFTRGKNYKRIWRTNDKVFIQPTYKKENSV